MLVISGLIYVFVIDSSILNYILISLSSRRLCLTFYAGRISKDCTKRKEKTYRVNYHFENQSSLIASIHFALSKKACTPIHLPRESNPVMKSEYAS